MYIDRRNSSPCPLGRARGCGPIQVCVKKVLIFLKHKASFCSNFWFWTNLQPTPERAISNFLIRQNFCPNQTTGAIKRLNQTIRSRGPFLPQCSFGGQRCRERTFIILIIELMDQTCVHRMFTQWIKRFSPGPMYQSRWAGMSTDIRIECSAVYTLRSLFMARSRDNKRFVSYGLCHCARPSLHFSVASAERVDSSSVLGRNSSFKFWTGDVEPERQKNR